MSEFTGTNDYNTTDDEVVRIEDFIPYKELDSEQKRIYRYDPLYAVKRGWGVDRILEKCSNVNALKYIAERYEELYPQIIEKNYPNLPVGIAKVIVEKGYYWNLLINCSAQSVKTLIEHLLQDKGYFSVEEWAKDNKSKAYNGSITVKKEIPKKDKVVSYWAIPVEPFSNRSFINGGSGNDKGDIIVVYGANVQYKDGSKWPTSSGIKRIANKVGEKYWYEFLIGKSTTFKNIESLKEYLDSEIGRDQNINKKEIDDSGFNRSYYFCR